MKHPAFLCTHIIFGMVAGGVYELLEVEKQVLETLKNNRK